ncbi:hypothetical protein IFR05_004291 [Cadophora sp. M221]|nr:hypothetical protein IFR05_004291 [Cadophora sp. M221]
MSVCLGNSAQPFGRKGPIIAAGNMFPAKISYSKWTRPVWMMQSQDDRQPLTSVRIAMTPSPNVQRPSSLLVLVRLALVDVDIIVSIYPAGCGDDDRVFPPFAILFLLACIAGPWIPL